MPAPHLPARHTTTAEPPGPEPTRVGLAPRPSRIPHPVYLAMGDAGSPEALAWVRAATRGRGVGVVYVDPPWNRAFVGRFHTAAARETESMGPAHSEAGTTVLPGVPDPAPATVAEAVYRIARTCHAAMTLGGAGTATGYIVVESGMPERDTIRHAFIRAGFEFTGPFSARYGSGKGTPQVVMVGRVHHPGVAPDRDIGLSPDTIACLTGVTSGFPRYGGHPATDGGFRGVEMAAGILDVLTRDPAVREALAGRPAVMDPCLGLGISYRATQALGWQLDTPDDGHPLTPPAFLGIELVPSRYRKTWDMVVTDNAEATRRATESVRRVVASRYRGPEGSGLP